MTNREFIKRSFPVEKQKYILDNLYHNIKPDDNCEYRVMIVIFYIMLYYFIIIEWYNYYNDLMGKGK